MAVQGKTVTLVEAIKQVEKTQPSCHILVCAPSNSATDMLCSRIADHVEKRKLYRMYARSHDPKLVPDNLKVSVERFQSTFSFPFRCY